MKTLYSLAAILVTFTVTAGVICTLACPHEIVRTFCPAGHHDCCPKQSSSPETCLTSNFLSTTKDIPPVILTAVIDTSHISIVPLAPRHAGREIQIQDVMIDRSVVLRI